MSKTHEKFIEKYKELENILDMPVREYEYSLTTEGSDEDAEKLRLCRYFRNYITHNADYEKMVSITPGMQEFLDDLVYKQHFKNGILKDHMTTLTKYGKLTVNNTIFEAAALMTKKKRDDSAVFDKNDKYIGHIRKSDISDLFGTGEITKTTKIGKFVDKLSVYPHLELAQSVSMDYITEIDGLKDFILVFKGNKVVGVL